TGVQTCALPIYFRDDYSTYHVVDYDTAGNAIHQQTNQGYADNSTWSRGQAWAIYGFTLMYRETKNPLFLQTAQGAADFYINHPNLPEDKIPYWDFKDRKSTRLNSSHVKISYAVFCLKKK